MTPRERARLLRATREQLSRGAPAAWRLLAFDPHGAPNDTADEAVLEIAALFASGVAAAWLDARIEIDALRQHIGDWLPDHFPRPHRDAALEAARMANDHASEHAAARANEKSAFVIKIAPPVASRIATKTPARK